jgi:hypothetical protein
VIVPVHRFQILNLQILDLLAFLQLKAYKDINPEFTPSYDSVQNEHSVQLLQDMKSMDDTNFTKTGIMDPSKVVIDDSPVDKSKSADKNTPPLADWDDNES